MQSATADALGLDDREVVVAETGVIGVPLEIELRDRRESERPRAASPATALPDSPARS